MRLALVMACACAGCASLPYSYARIPAWTAPKHPLRVVIVPLADAREVAPPPFESVSAEFGSLEREPATQVTEILARHLTAAGIFSAVTVAGGPDEVSGADLVLTGKLKRLQGSVSRSWTNAPLAGAAFTPRTVFAEAVLEELELRPSVPGAAARIRLDVGGVVDESRQVGSNWVAAARLAMAEALRGALDDLTRELVDADLSGAHQVRDRVQLELPPMSVTSTAGAGVFGRLQDSPPAGWRVARTVAHVKPEGWRGDSECMQLVLQDSHSRHFSRTLGRYRSETSLWACPEPALLAMDSRSGYPARVLGRARGHWFLWRAVGKTNWPDAESQVAAYLGLDPVAHRHVFQLGPAVPR